MYTSFDKRMKGYERSFRQYLPERMPVVIRIDGKAFHTFTRGFAKPFDEILRKTMVMTTKYLCENIENCKLGYTQSDEISLLLINYNTLDVCSWFDNSLNKMLSISASLATEAFNYYFEKFVTEYFADKSEEEMLNSPYFGKSKFDLNKKEIKRANFDARAFVLPKEEVCNYFIWRQQDASRNSVNMVAQANFPHKELQNISCEQMQEKLWQEKKINWNDFPVVNKRGSCVTREEFIRLTVVRHRWEEDTNIPIFTKNREYIEKFVFVGE